MIEEKDGVFYICSGEMSYMFRVTEDGQLEHLHFGPRVRPEDAEALTLRPGTGWGYAVLGREDEPGSCPDTLPLEWSGAGRGDYRESPAELWDESGPAGTEFRFAGYEIMEGGAPMRSGLPQAGGAEGTLAVRMADAALGAELTLYYSAFSGVLTRRTVLKNTGASPLRVRKLMSACLDVWGEFDMHTFDGGWIAEAHAETVPVSHAGTVNESGYGFSSAVHNPAVMLAERGAGEDNGEVVSEKLAAHGKENSISIRIPPMSTVYLELERVIQESPEEADSDA